jgi:hypothetical protein
VLLKLPGTSEMTLSKTSEVLGNLGGLKLPRNFLVFPGNAQFPESLPTTDRRLI